MGTSRRPWSLLATVRLLVVVLGAMVLLVALIAALGRAKVHGSTNDLRVRVIPAQDAAADLSMAYVDQETGQRGFVLTGDERFLQPYLAGLRAQQVARQEIGALLRDTASRRDLADVDTAGDRWRALAAEPEIQARSAGPIPATQLAELTDRGRQLFDELRVQLGALDAHVNALADRQLRTIARDQRTATLLVLPIVVVAIVVTAGAALLLQRRLVRPTRRLVDDVSAIAGGDYDRPVSSDGPKELRDIAEAVEAMRASTLRYGDELAESQHRLARRTEQDRLSADLHDLIVQRVFGVGLRLESAAQRHPQLADTLRPLVDDTDEIIRELRSVIFDLRHAGGGGGLTGEIEDVVEECSRGLSFQPRLRIAGDVNSLPLDSVGADLLACVRELLSNVARHAKARSATVDVSIADGVLALRVTDDGVGIAPGRRVGDGTGNVAFRAHRLGGGVTTESAPGVGTTVTWRVPVG